MMGGWMGVEPMLVLANGECLATRWQWWCPKCRTYGTCAYDPIDVIHGGCGGIIKQTNPIYANDMINE